MHDIGNVLRDARRARNLDLPQCEQATKIRAKYLMAMEEERFEILPEPVFVRGMLKTYATYLGVDPEPILEAHTARLPEPAHHQGPGASTTFASRRGTSSRRGRRIDPRLVAFGVGAAIVVAALWWLAGRGDEASRPTSVSISTTVNSTGATTRPSGAPAPVVLVLLANSASPAQIQVHRVDAEGPIVYAGELGRGQRRRIPVDGPLWVHVAPAGGTVAARLGGRAIVIPALDAGVVVTPEGLLG